jgi:hypothetical protein
MPKKKIDKENAIWISLNEQCRIFIISVENNENAYTDPIGSVMRIAGTIPLSNDSKCFFI